MKTVLDMIMEEEEFDIDLYKKQQLVDEDVDIARENGSE